MNSLAKRVILFALKIDLRIHSFSYRLAGSLSHKVEQGGLHPKTSCFFCSAPNAWNQ